MSSRENESSTTLTSTPTPALSRSPGSASLQHPARSIKPRRARCRRAARRRFSPYTPHKHPDPQPCRGQKKSPSERSSELPQPFFEQRLPSERFCVLLAVGGRRLFAAGCSFCHFTRPISLPGFFPCPTDHVPHVSIPFDTGHWRSRPLARTACMCVGYLFSPFAVWTFRKKKRSWIPLGSELLNSGGGSIGRARYY